MPHFIAESIQLLVGRLQLGSALAYPFLELSVEPPDSLLRFPFRGDVMGNLGKSSQPACFVPHRGNHAFHPELRAILADSPTLVVRLAFCFGLAQNPLRHSSFRII